MTSRNLSRLVKAARYDPRNLIYPFRYPRFFLKGILLFNGNGIRCHSTARLENQGCLQFGCFWDFWRARGGIVLHRDACLRTHGKIVLGDGVLIEVHEGARLEIGGGTFINPNTRIIVLESIRIGGDCAVAWDVQIMDGDRHFFLDKAGERERNTAPIRIGEHVWIGARSVILKGSSIGDGAVVGAGAVVSGSVPPCTVVAGNPARRIKEGVRWEK